MQLHRLYKDSELCIVYAAKCFVVLSLWLYEQGFALGISNYLYLIMITLIPEIHQLNMLPSSAYQNICVCFLNLDIIWLDSHILQKLLMPSLFFISRSLTIINQGTLFIRKLFKLAFHIIFYSIITKGPQKCSFVRLKIVPD